MAITLEQIQNIQGTLTIGDHIINKYEDGYYEVYKTEDAEDSDPDPLISTNNAQEILNFIQTL